MGSEGNEKLSYFVTQQDMLTLYIWDLASGTVKHQREYHFPNDVDHSTVIIPELGVGIFNSTYVSIRVCVLCVICVCIVFI